MSVNGNFASATPSLRSHSHYFLPTNLYKYVKELSTFVPLPYGTNIGGLNGVKNLFMSLVINIIRFFVSLKMTINS